jgi:hypothetical protein
VLVSLLALRLLTAAAMQMCQRMVPRRDALFTTAVSHTQQQQQQQ